MADQRTSIVITARDDTRAAFASAQAGMAQLSAVAARMTAVIPGLGAAIGAIGGGGLVALVNNVIEVGDRYNDLSQQIGISVRDLAQWELAAKQSGTSTEGLAQGVKKLAKYMTEDAAGLRSLGVTATDANGALVQLAGVFSQLDDGVEKTALATKIFGKSGADLIPLLNLGAKGLAESAEKSRLYADRMKELAPVADKFNDTLAELGINAKAAGASIATDLLQPINELLEKMAEAQRHGAGLFSSMAVGLRLGNTDTRPLDDLRERAAELQNRLSQNMGSSGFPGMEARDAADRAELEILQKIIAARLKLARGFQGDVRSADNLLAADKDSAQSRLAAVRALLAKDEKQGSAAKTPLERALEEQRKRLAAINAAAGDEQMESADTVSRRYATADEADLEKRRIAMEKMAEKRMEDQRIEAEGEEAIREAMEKTNRAMEKQTDLSRDLGLTFSSAFEDAIISGKKLSDVLRSLAQDILRIVVRKTVTDPIGNAVSKGVDTLLEKGLGAIFDSFGGGRANGGPVSPGQFYVVGENGPEVLLPQTSGTVVPMSGGGGAPSFHFQIDARGADAGVSARIEAGVQRAVRLAVDAVAWQAGRGGAYAKAVGRA